MDWKPIAELPDELRDGRVLRLKRVHEGSVVIDDIGFWGVLAADAPLRHPDDFGFVPPDDCDAPRWLRADGRFRFPEPTHWADHDA